MNLDTLQIKSDEYRLAAVVYVAIRESNESYTLKDITQATGLRKNKIVSYYRRIITHLNLKMPIFDVTQYVSKIADSVDVSQKTLQDAYAILTDAKKKNHLAGKDPTGLAAAAIYLAANSNNEKISQKHLEVNSGVSQVTIRNRCKELKNLS